jgi:1-acyl-sn-glycerol-3-phosphate acyltransferase
VKIIRTIYTIWLALAFILAFMLMFLPIFIFLQKPSWKPYAHKCNEIAARLFWILGGIPLQIERSPLLDSSATYVFCSNHFSYLDIPSMMVVVPNYFAFIGKMSVKNVPFFGYMFTKLHIQVNREDKNSRSVSLARSIKTLQSGRSIVIFPEGGIRTKNAPQMYESLQNGAFVMAIQQQVPVVPVSLTSNYKIWADETGLSASWYPMKAIVHDPIPTVGLTNDDLETLKEQVRAVIQAPLG